MVLQLADVVDNEAMQVYMKPPAHGEAKAASKGFVVRDAPWTPGNTEKVGTASSMVTLCTERMARTLAGEMNPLIMKLRVSPLISV